jgi:hypothetical protein
VVAGGLLKTSRIYLYRISSLRKTVLTGAAALFVSVEAPYPLQLVAQHKYIGLRKATPLVGWLATITRVKLMMSSSSSHVATKRAR